MSKGKRKNSRAKGKRGELELASAFAAEGFASRRGQQHKGGPGSADVEVDDLPWLHAECKRTEAFRLWDAVAQAVRDAGDGMPVVFHRRNRSDWVAVLRFEDFIKLAREYEGPA